MNCFTYADCYVEIDSIEIPLVEDVLLDTIEKGTFIPHGMLRQRVVITSEPDRFSWIDFLCGMIISIIGTIVFNKIFRTKMRFGDYVAVDYSEGDNKHISFYVENAICCSALNVTAFVYFVYEDLQGKIYMQPLKLYRSVVPFMDGNTTKDIENKSHCFICCEHRDFMKYLKSYESLINNQSIKQASIKIVVTSTHNLSGLVSKSEKYYSLNSVKKGKYLEGKFVESK